MRKISYSSDNITPFGGLNFIFSALNRSKITDFIDHSLGNRNYRAKYNYSDIVLSLLGNSLCNGEYLSDLEYFKDKFKKQTFQYIPSPDTVEYAFQELKVPNEIVITENNVEHQINQNKKINSLLVSSCVKLGLLKSETKDYVLDFDNVVIETEKQDAKKSYKMKNAYHPAFANIGNKTVYFENRNGNTPAKYGQKKALENCFNNLKNNNISINSYRGDSASYQKEVFDVLEQNVSHFYIRNITCQGFRKICSEAKDWQKIEINNEIKEVTSVKYSPFKGENEYRIVASRTQANPNEQGVLFEEYQYNYYGIITNNLTMSELEVIQFYNQRGDASENNNKNLLNDFNINHLPFMDLDTNTIYMGIMALCSNLFEWIKHILVKNKVEGIELKHRTKRVFMRYICVCSQFIKHARAVVLKIFSETKYQKLQI